MSANTIFLKQVKLLLDVLTYVKQEPCFALKGGTAINLFIRNMPRLSVDIDLVYLPIEPREIFLENLEASLLRLSVSLTNAGYKVVHQYTRSPKHLVKLLVSNGEVDIKIEPNTILRGTVFGGEAAELCPKAQDEFLLFQTIKMISKADVYAGKICAALDRQHPRDLFDIKLLFDHEGITDQIRQAFVIYLASSPRPMSELLAPNILDMKESFVKDFVGMTEINVEYQELCDVRERLIQEVRDSLIDNEKNFLLSIKQGKPDFSLMPIADLELLPALRWKVKNVLKMSESARSKALAKLETVLQN